MENRFHHRQSYSSTSSSCCTFFGPANTPLSDLAESNLAQLSEYLDTSFDDSNVEHIQLLQELWKVQWNIPYQRKAEKWKHAGWQTDDPTQDLKASGMLAIHSLIYFGNKFPAISTDRIAKNQANVKTNYPYAVVGVNLTLLLADLLALKDSRYVFVSVSLSSTIPVSYLEIKQK